MAGYQPLRGYIVEEAERHILTVSDDPTRQTGGKRHLRDLRASPGGLDVKWRSRDGIVSNRGAVTYLPRKHSWIPKDGFDRQAFEPGDVCVIPRANHHFIVVEAPPGADTLCCIAGNGNQQQIEWQDHSRQSIVTHYSLVWDPFASRR